MKLTPPKQLTFWISVVLAALGFLGFIIPLGFISSLSFWFVFVGYLLLFLGLMLKGL
jgi:hypothetical protein